ncbi:MAG: hypothetical protein L0Y72_03200 [Gemmataceae bacterium]|nr:hypothetical protein [Gemmataceae bacterium]MCI0738024.1 hypothetical protein [Gemmataceae bacterium]
MLEELKSWWLEVQTWWQDASPETRLTFQSIGVVIGALLVGYIVGGMVTRSLRAKNFDAALRIPGSSAPPDGERGFTPTVVAGLLVRFTIWAVAGAWLARQHGKPDLSATLGLVVERTWALAGILVATLAVGSLLARRLTDVLQGPRAEWDGRNGAAPPQRSGPAAAVAVGVYVVVLLLVLLVAADMFNWPLTRSSTQALWNFAHQVLIAGSALLIGYLGARWARDLVTHPATSSEQRVAQYTGLGIVSAATILALGVLLSSFGVLVGLAAVAVLGFLVWLARDYLPDVWAGLQLRAYKIREVWFEGVAYQVSEVGLLNSQLCQAGEFCRVQNRLVLNARFQQAPHEAVSR